VAANHKRVHRLYREAGLSLRRKRKRLMRLKCVFPQTTASNEEWALDFAADSLASQRHLRILSVVDVFTRECRFGKGPVGGGVIYAWKQMFGGMEVAEAQELRTDRSSPAAASLPGAWTGGSS
jgi:hypothetical protein